MNREYYDLTPKINEFNIENVRKNIKVKMAPAPFYGTMNVTAITDMDSFPYMRFYRGVPGFSDPVVMEREAGWRPIRNNCYAYAPASAEPIKPKVCFETACSTLLPCRPSEEAEQEDYLLNKRFCLNMYR